MGGRIPNHFIDDLLTRGDIVGVIERRVPLKKAGREWTACCPFHNERTPSFHVSPAKQFYHCFGCGAHGSAIRFLMEYEHLEFVDAVEELAREAGMPMVYEGGRDPRQSQDRGDLYALLDSAASWYQQQLAQSPQAQAYCRQRGLEAATIERFRIGWAPQAWDGVIRAVGQQQAQRLKLLEQAGMVSNGERGKPYDRFRGRLMFPIMDRRGRVIAFGARILDGDGPKYLNSPQTPLFHKGRELFGLWQCKQTSGKLERLLVVEGYMDAIALHQAGLPIAVATLGTATTPEHVELLLRAAPDVVFCFDGDRAGRAAAWKALEAALPKLGDGRQAWFLFLPEGEDPDSLVRSEGVDSLRQRLAAAMPLSQYFFDELGRDIDLRALDGRARLAERARSLIAKLPDSDFRDLMAQELQQRSGASVRLAAAPPLRAAAARRNLIRSSIALLLAQPALAQELAPPYAFAALDRPGVPLLIELIELARQRPGIRTGALLEHFAGRREYEALHKLAAATLISDAKMQRDEFSGALEQLRRQSRAQRLNTLSTRLSELNEAEKSELRTLLAERGGGETAHLG